MAVPLHNDVEVDKPLAALNLTLALLQKSDRRKGRRQIARMWLETPHALGAAMYLIGEAARGAGNVEVYLDQMFWRQVENDAGRFVRARALAARWRGDKSAAERWEKLAKRSYELLPSGYEAYLAYPAGL